MRTKYEAMGWEVAVNGVAARPAKALALQQQRARRTEDGRKQGWTARVWSRIGKPRGSEAPAAAAANAAAVSTPPPPRADAEEVKDEAAEAQALLQGLHRHRAERHLQLAPNHFSHYAATDARETPAAAKPALKSRAERAQDSKPAPEVTHAAATAGLEGRAERGADDRSRGGGVEGRSVELQVALSLRAVRHLVKQASAGVARANRQRRPSSSTSPNIPHRTPTAAAAGHQAAVAARRDALEKYNRAVAAAQRIQALAPRLSFEGCVRVG